MRRASELTADYLLNGPDDEGYLKPRKRRRKDKATVLGLEYVSVHLHPCAGPLAPSRQPRLAGGLPSPR